jgi:guanylate cyclase
VVLWSLICPIGALIFAGPRQAVRWFLLYLLLVVISGYLQAYVRTTNNLSSSLVVSFFVLNVSAISAIVFGLLVFFINQKDIAYRLLDAEREKSENLLLNILPKEIAEILKNQGGALCNICHLTIHLPTWSSQTWHCITHPIQLPRCVRWCAYASSADAS